MLNNLPRVARIQSLFKLLNSGERYLTAEKVAERLDISTRTFFRYLQVLSAFGLEIDKSCGYRIQKGDLLSFIKLTPSDLQLIEQLTDSSPLTQFPDMEEAFNRLRIKLELMLTEEENEDTAIQYAESPICDRLAFCHETLEQACTEHRVCEITYQALDETEPSLRTIHPYSIAIRGSQWYLIAQDEAKDEFRLYHFLRIKNVEMLDHLFKKDEAVQIDRFFEDSWSVFQGKKQMVRLKARGVAARLLSERASPKRIELEWIGPDEGIAEIEVRGEQEILNWALSMGPDVEILEPTTLRDRLRQQLTATLHNYE